MTLTLAELAAHVEGQVVGDDQVNISGVGSLARAKTGEISHYSNQRFKAQLEATKASAIVLDANSIAICPASSVVVANPQFAFAQIAALFDRRIRTPVGIHPTAKIDSSAQIGKDVRFGPNVQISAHCHIDDGVELCANVCIGAYSVVGAETCVRENVVLYHDVRVGERCLIHSNTTIGSDGFGIVPDERGMLHDIPQVGGVRIGSDVSIGSSCSVDRGAIDDTVIHDNVKLDNQVHIGHNCEIGEHSILCGRTGLAGSVTIGTYCVLAGSVGVAGDGPLTITDGVEIGAMTFVSRDIDKPGRYSGATLHTDNAVWRRNMLRLNELDALAKRIKKLETTLAKQTSGLESNQKSE